MEIYSTIASMGNIPLPIGRMTTIILAAAAANKNIQKITTHLARFHQRGREFRTPASFL